MRSHLCSSLVLRLSAAVLALSLAGCEAAPVAGTACARASECRSPLVCSYGRCRVECRATRDCPLGSRCIASAGLGVCTLTVESHCDTAVCPAPLLCVADQCRTECRTNAQCISGSCVMATCVEPVSGVDAGMPEDAGTPDAFSPDAFLLPDAGLGTCTPATASVMALVGAPMGRGLSATFRTVTDLTTGSPAAIAVGAVGGITPLAGSYVATIDGAVPRLFHAATEPNPFIELTPWTGMQATAAWSIDVSVDAGNLLVMFMRQPADGGDAFAWAIDSTSIDAAMVSGLTPGRALDVGETFHGELAIVGGRSPFSGSAQGVFYVFHTEVPGVGGTIGATDRSQAGTQWRTPGTFPTAFRSHVLEMTATHGRLVVFRDPGSRAVGYWLPEPWATGTPTAGTAAVGVLRDADVLPGLASAPDGSTSILAWAMGNAVELEQITCMPSACGVPVALGTVATGSSNVVAVAMTELARGYALAVGRVGGAVDVFLVDGVTSTAMPFAAVSTFARSAGNDTIVRLDLTATPTDSGASVLLGVLSEDRSLTRHVWTASYEVCTP